MADIKKGDKVQYLNDVGGGIVTKILSPKMVEIKDDSGFEIPVATSELIISKSSMDSSQETKTIKQPEHEEIINIPGNDTPYIYFAIVPLPDKDNSFDIYIINDSNYWMLFTCSSLFESYLNILESGTIEPNIKVHIGSYSSTELIHMQSIIFQSLLYNNKPYTYYHPIDTTIHIPHKKLYAKGVFIENDFFDEDAWVIPLYDSSQIKIEEQLQNTDLHKIIQQKEHASKRPRTSQTKNKKDEIREIDLHIHELVDDEKSISKEEILSVQIDAFEKALNKALQDNINKLVCIHGVGNGILKTKIRSILDKDYSHLFYQDASFQKYKFGATVIYFRKIYK
ncbi:MAG: DUF2027 domain-containing protein [Bacteroidales bacterium]